MLRSPGSHHMCCIGPLLDLPSWIDTFPRIDTVNASGAQKTDNSRVQGTVSRTAEHPLISPCCD